MQANWIFSLFFHCEPDGNHPFQSPIALKNNSMSLLTMLPYLNVSFMSVETVWDVLQYAEV